VILVIDVCSEKLHFYEFVRPVLDVVGEREVLCVHYLDLTEKELGECDKVVICGTSLKDDGFLGDLNEFDWLKGFEKPVLGICAGFQILGLVLGGELKKKLEIGFFKESFEDEFLGLKGEVEVYHLHNNYAEFGKDWEVFSGKDFAQAVKRKNFYGVLFHPEVRNKEMILEFCGL